ncbi:MAG: RNA 2',3'-cyclic phosphodiesterase [Desulfobacterales bacterium]|nr:RNA 2',3'-cyclic phosphodiesterase [Desulfobacterales bacterium]
MKQLDTIRTFIAIEISEQARTTVCGIQNDLKSRGFKAKWIQPENIHLTLKFLGDISPEKVEDITAAMISAAETYLPVQLFVKGVGVFPNVKRPRIIWSGVTGDLDSLTGLQKSLDKKFETLGFASEKRPFKGHLTIARTKHQLDSKKMVDAIEAFRGKSSEPFLADRIILFQSELNNTGAVYTPLKSVTL